MFTSVTNASTTGLTLLAVLTNSLTANAGDCGPALTLSGGIVDLDSGVTTSMSRPSAAFNTIDLEYRVFWSDWRTGQSGLNDVYAQRVSTDGRTVGGNVDISTGAVNHLDTAVAHDPNTNQYFAAWRTQSGGAAFNHAYGASVSATGGLLQSPYDLSNGGLEPHLVFNSVSGKFFYVGRNYNGGGPSGIRGQHIDAAGAPMGDAISVAPDPPDQGHAPVGGVAFNAIDNQYLTTWRAQTGMEGGRSLQGRIVNGDGSFAEEPFVISETFPIDDSAGVAFDPVMQRYFVVFGHNESGGPVSAQFVSPSGARIGPQLTLFENTSSSPQTLIWPSVAYDPINEAFLVAWRERDPQPPFEAPVSAALFDLNGESLGAAQLIGGSAIGTVTIVADTINGGFLITWLDWTNFEIDPDDPPHADIVAQLVKIGDVSTCAADLTCDAAVGPADLAVVLGEWGRSESTADLNNDGEVGAADLAIVLGTWGACP